MDIAEFKKEYIVSTELGIDSSYGRILTVIDFGNVNYWFDEDRQDSENRALADDETFRINLSGLKDFAGLFSNDIRFYYGHDVTKHDSLRFLSATRHVFGGKRVFTKPIQKVRHHLSSEELQLNKRITFLDGGGVYVQIPKCNFDVEISVDAIRLLDMYDTLALFSGDADFVSLARFLRKKGKKVILFKAGYITTDLRTSVNKVVNAQNIKKHIAEVATKQRPGTRPGLANR